MIYDGEGRQAAGATTLPTIVVGWDAEKQLPTVHFDTKGFKNLGFVIGVLQMAVEEAKFQLGLQRMVAMQQQQMDAAMTEQVKRELTSQVIH